MKPNKLNWVEVELKRVDYDNVRGFVSPNVSWKIKSGRRIAFVVAELACLLCMFVPYLRLTDVVFGELTSLQNALVAIVFVFPTNVAICCALSRLPYFRAD